MVRYAWLVVLVACGGGHGATPDASPSGDAGPDAPPVCADAGVPSASADCTGAGCPAIAISGDSPAANSGTFHGFADPSIAHDPSAPHTLWLAYSWPHAQQGTAADGSTVEMGAVSTHLAKSVDDGATYAMVGELWSAPAVTDPEGSGEVGVASSETASLASIATASGVTWYGAHLRYFLRPLNGYNPTYGTSWTVHIAAASTPAGLATAPETVLGVSTTASVYQPAVRLDQLANVWIGHCAMLNNPTLFTRDGTLYLIVECLAFMGTTLDPASSTTQVFATTPSGAPATWTWRYVGVIADQSLATELGDVTVQQPDVSLAADGTPILIVTPAHPDGSQVGTAADGCVALALESIDPPKLARDCAGRAIVRARITGAGIGACTHDAAAAVGIVPVEQNAGWSLRASSARP